MPCIGVIPRLAVAHPIEEARNLLHIVGKILCSEAGIALQNMILTVGLLRGIEGYGVEQGVIDDGGHFLDHV